MPAAVLKAPSSPSDTIASVVDLNKITAKQAVVMCIAIADDATRDDVGLLPGRHAQAHIVARASTLRTIQAIKLRFGL